jgi:hypothetical protein
MDALASERRAEMQRKWRALLLLVVLGLTLTVIPSRNARAQDGLAIDPAVQPSEVEAPIEDADAEEDAVPFPFDGITWRNQEVGGSATRCGTAHPDSVEAAEIQDQLERFNTSRGGTAEGFDLERDAGTVAVSVFFHVITNGTSVADGNVPESWLNAQLNVLNKAFSGRTGGKNTPFRFVKYHTDRWWYAPWYTAGPDSAAERQMKAALGYRDPRVLNLYISKPSQPAGILGWARFPWDYARDPVLDGVVVLNGTLPGGSASSYNKGDTTVHEVGHWLGLYHVFQGGCAASATHGGDFVNDTPAQADPSFGCPVGRNSCRSLPGLDPIRNFMNYVIDSCMFEFTNGQSVRMDAAAFSFRGL